MQHPSTRREFLKQSSLLTASLWLSSSASSVRAAAESPGNRLRVGIIGCNSRGMDHIAGFLAVPNVEIVCVCDVDRRAMEKGVAAVARKQSQAPRGVGDLRRVLDDPGVDAVSIATPDHWHAPATIMACAAGKHVYVEKPGSHNAHESTMMIAAVRKGEIGKTFFARTWYANRRVSIGRGETTPVPEWLDYSMWQGPAPERPYKSNVVHYNWHWFWNWGTGELGNNGVHSLDLARWGLEVDLPRRVTCGGNRYHFSDDWETPDTAFATFDFGGKGISWEGRSCAPRGVEGAGFGVSFHGENGVVIISGNDYRVCDLNDKLVREVKGKGDDVLHFANFADAIRRGEALSAEIGEGQKSSMLCHLGNIAWRTGHTVNFDPVAGRILKDKAAEALWKRTYRRGWELRA
jgi:predicted dehydrogenase